MASFGLYWQHKNDLLLEKEYRYYLSELAQSQAIAIEQRLYSALSATNILSLEVKQNNGDFSDFDRYAAEVIDSIGGISNLQLAPNGVISKIYPLKGNEKAIGHKILIDDKRKKEAKLAIEKKQLTLAGPFELIQGGVAVIGRNPVFIKENNQDVFWGFVSAMIFIEDLLASSKLSRLKDDGYVYQLSRMHPDTQKTEVFSSSSDHKHELSESIKINVPNADWTLTVSTSAYNSSNYTAYLVNIALGLIFALGIAYLFQRPEYLKGVVSRKTKELENLVFHDPLTSLGNRRLLTKKLQQLLAAGNTQNSALLYLDLDDFKRINDSLGHSSGDYLLKEIALRLGNIVKHKDIVTRLGGDEFALLLFNIQSSKTVKLIAERIINEVKKPVIFGDRSLAVSASLGIALIPKDGDSEEDLLRNVDIAMYDAKNSGKNSYRFFDKELQLEALEKHQIELALTNVTERDELFLLYQPLTCLHEKKVIGYEALLRWTHPERGLLPPNKFVYVAEHTGQIIPIGYWVFRQACQAVKKYTQKNSEPFFISINLSSKQFLDPFLVENLTNILQDEKVGPERILIEVTESSLTVDVKSAINTLNRLRDIGISIAIDDFGTGYSSLSQLKNFPVDCLKIDRSFIKSLSDDENDQEIVKAVIAMSHTLKINVVAEGIEKQEQLEWLMEHNCDVGQGYLFARPSPIKELI